MLKKPLVTVFIPYYNDEKFLKTSIEAVLNNDYQNFELVLLNHATSDSCREIAQFSFIELVVLLIKKFFKQYIA